MSSFPEPRPKVLDGDLISISDFAQQYRVDASVVRSWIKMGYIGYTLDGPRKMRKISKAEVLVPIPPVSDTIVSDPPTPPVPPIPEKPQTQGAQSGQPQPGRTGSNHQGSRRR